MENPVPLTVLLADNVVNAPVLAVVAPIGKVFNPVEVIVPLSDAVAEPMTNRTILAVWVPITKSPPLE